MLLQQRIIGIVLVAVVIITVGVGFYFFRKSHATNSVKVKKLQVPHFSLDKSAPNYLQKAVKTKKGVSVILFFRYGCHFSRNFLPTFQKLAKQKASLNAFFGAVEMDNKQVQRSEQKKQVKQMLGITIHTFPYIAIFKDGTVAQVMEGDENARTEKNIKKILKSVIKDSQKT